MLKAPLSFQETDLAAFEVLSFPCRVSTGGLNACSRASVLSVPMPGFLVLLEGRL